MLRESVSSTRMPARGGRLQTTRQAAFTLTELLIVLAIIVILVSILLAALSGGQQSRKSIQCLSGLRYIAVSFRLYAADNNETLPDPSSAQSSWESMLEKYLSGRAIFRCPADGELFPSVGSSYDWRDTGDPATTLAGRKLTDPIRSDAVMIFDGLPEWHAKGRNNVAYIDGSSHDIPQNEFFIDLTLPAVR